MAIITLPPQSYLRELFYYDPATGAVTWRINARNAGKRAESPRSQGYMSVRVNGRNVQAHRMIWKWMTGEEPPEKVDHWNMIGSDNRWCNLRAADASTNRFNSKTSSTNKTGLKGVHKKYEGRFSAKIKCRGRTRYLGRFDTAEEAHAAYCRAARELFGEFWNPG